MARADASTTLEVPESALRIRYYHQDHLGSSGLISDKIGQVVEESSFYAFGKLRNEFQPVSISEGYKFTQKEQDSESLLNYFDVRYQVAGLSRFLSFDPLVGSGSVFEPQRGNPYAYCGNRPIVMVDPTGCAHELTTEGGGGPASTTSEKTPNSNSDTSFKDVKQGISTTKQITKIGNAIVEETRDAFSNWQFKRMGGDPQNLNSMVKGWGTASKVLDKTSKLIAVGEIGYNLANGQTREAGKNTTKFAAGQIGGKLAASACTLTAAAFGIGTGGIGAVAVGITCTAIGIGGGELAKEGASQMYDKYVPGTQKCTPPAGPPTLENYRQACGPPPPKVCTPENPSGN